MSDEPAIPIIAPLPVQAHRSLLNLAEREWPTLQEPGVLVTVDATEKGARISATVVAYRRSDLDIELLGRWSASGEWAAGATVRWTPGRRAKP